MTSVDRVSRTKTSPLNRTVSVKTPRKTPPGHNGSDDSDSSGFIGNQQIRTQTVILRCPKCRHAIVAHSGGAHCLPCALPMLPVKGRHA